MIPQGWMFLFGLLLLLCFAVFGYIIYIEFIVPYITLISAQIEPPPKEGSEFEFVMGESERSTNYMIGRIGSNLNTKCTNISEGHLVFQFKKARDSEEYEITIKKGGAVLVKPPRMNVYSKMESSLKLESHEVIGKTVDFRISDSMVKERMTSYIELQMTSKFFVNSKGVERMKFIFKITKIHPGMKFKKNNQHSYSLNKAMFKDDDAIEEAEEMAAAE